MTIDLDPEFSKQKTSLVSALTVHYHKKHPFPLRTYNSWEQREIFAKKKVKALGISRNI